MAKPVMLLIGRFQPFHRGHLHIVKRYAARGYRVKVAIGSAEKAHVRKDPFTVEERKEMIRLAVDEAGVDDVEVYHIPDTPDDKEWVENVCRIVGDFDVVFTGNKWVSGLFSDCGVKLHTYDESRERHKGISAKNIRKRWLRTKSRKGLPPAVFQYLKAIGAFERVREMNDPKKRVHHLLVSQGLTVSAVESCTGGAIAKALVSYSGSSAYFKAGVVAYSNEAKKGIVDLPQETLQGHSSVSRETTRQLAERMRRLAGTDYAVASTGYADPSDKKSGLVYLAIASERGTYDKEENIKLKNRNRILTSATARAIRFLYHVLKEEKLGL